MSSNRENWIVLPIILGLILEIVLRVSLQDSIPPEELLRLDLRGKMSLFVMSFLIFYAITPRSLRLLSFMGMLLGASLLSVVALPSLSYLVPIGISNFILDLTFTSLLNFNLMYRCLEVFIIFSWISGIKQNVISLCNSFNYYVGTHSNSRKGTTR